MSEESTLQERSVPTNEGTVGEERSKRRIVRSKLSLLTSIVAFLLSLALLLYVVINFIAVNKHTPKSLSPYAAPRDPEGICVLCEILPGDITADPPVINMTITVDDGVKVCCVGTASELSFLLEKAVETPQARDISQTCANSKYQEASPASAHVGMLPPDKGREERDSGTHIFVTFDPTNLNTNIEHVRHVTVVKSGIRIRYPGHYYVYSQVLYKSPNSDNDDPPQTLYHGIHRLSPNSPKHTKSLTKVAHTICTGCHKANDTAFSGGTFHLLEDDLLSVCVSDDNLINYNKVDTFFGVTMLNYG